MSIETGQIEELVISDGCQEAGLLRTCSPEWDFQRAMLTARAYPTGIFEIRAERLDGSLMVIDIQPTLELLSLMLRSAAQWSRFREAHLEPLEPAT